MRRAALLAACLACTVAACGDDADDDAAVAVETPAEVARAASQTVDGESGRISGSVTIAGMPQAFDGAYDRAGRVDLDVTLDDGTSRTVVDGTTLYLCGDECRSIDVDVALAPPAIDPVALVRVLVGASRAEPVDDDADDDDAHVTGTLTLGRALDRIEPDQADAIERQLEAWGGDVDQVLDDPVAYDAWFDADGHVRRLVTELLLGDGGTFAVDISVDDVGADVVIDVPAGAEDITDERPPATD